MTRFGENFGWIRDYRKAVSGSCRCARAALQLHSIKRRSRCTAVFPGVSVLSKPTPALSKCLKLKCRVTSQAGRRGFEPRLPLHLNPLVSWVVHQKNWYAHDQLLRSIMTSSASASLVRSSLHGSLAETSGNPAGTRQHAAENVPGLNHEQILGSTAINALEQTAAQTADPHVERARILRVDDHGPQSLRRRISQARLDAAGCARIQ